MATGQLLGPFVDIGPVPKRKGPKLEKVVWLIAGVPEALEASRDGFSPVGKASRLTSSAANQGLGSSRAE